MEKNIKIFYDAVIQVESAGNPLACRFEEGFYRRIDINDIACKRLIEHYRKNDIKFISNDTVRALLSFSITRIQIMGYNIFRIDSIYRFFTERYLYVVPANILFADEYEIFKLFLKARGLYSKIEKATTQYLHMNDDLLREFSVKYNGSENYMLRLKPVLSRLIRS